MKNLLLILFFAVCLSSCGTTNQDFFYRGTITKANGKVKQKTFIFGRDACIRKSKRMARRRAARRSPDRNPNYGITAGGGAKQRR